MRHWIWASWSGGYRPTWCEERRRLVAGIAFVGRASRFGLDLRTRGPSKLLDQLLERGLHPNGHRMTSRDFPLQLPIRLRRIQQRTEERLDRELRATRPSRISPGPNSHDPRPNGASSPDHSPAPRLEPGSLDVAVPKLDLARRDRVGPERLGQVTGGFRHGEANFGACCFRKRGEGGTGGVRLARHGP